MVTVCEYGRKAHRLLTTDMTRKKIERWTSQKNLLQWLKISISE